MADTKISALSAASAAALANEIAINEAGTTKKLTVQQIVDLIGIKTKLLGSDFASPGTTMGKATGLDYTLAAGTYWFEYRCVFQTSVAGTAVKLGVNFSGTQTLYTVECTGYEGTTAASTGAIDQSHAAFGLRSGGAERTPSTTASIFGPTAIDTINANTMAIIKGVIVVTVSGDLQLYFGSEATGSTQTLKAGTALRVTKVG